MKNLKEELDNRWLLFQSTSDIFFEKFNNWWEVCYTWFDPTADSLHLWNFVWFMVAVHMMFRWNKYIALTWWATWMIWDPGWKDSERNFLSEEDLENNQKAISNQITNIIKNLEKFTWKKLDYDFVNNKVFYTNMWYLDFLREVWKYITINNMISKDTVKKRVEDPNQSISYTEFSYMLLQWYDFYKLNNDQNVTLQMWWQDQWGNLVTWVEITRKKADREVYAMTWPLITDASWKKFGKSEWNALWLDKNKTSPYELYQYFMNTNDNDIKKYLKILTLVETDEIDKLVSKHLESPENREWQKLLAYKVVEIIHWTYESDLALKISDFMFSWVDRLDILSGLSDEEISIFKNSIWGFEYKWENLFETIVKSWLSKSNSEARQAVQSWAIYIQEQKIIDFKYDFSNDFINEKVLLIRKWKKNFRIINK